mmetsp:Transcript_118840/g.296371  ORF Transcript_118840/g.296371 Transcript_118840/m.296371 type:complete len:238 (+) Transcript_118840:155-868(+)
MIALGRHYLLSTSIRRFIADGVKRSRHISRVCRLSLQPGAEDVPRALLVICSQLAVGLSQQPLPLLSAGSAGRARARQAAEGVAAEVVHGGRAGARGQEEGATLAAARRGCEVDGPHAVFILRKGRSPGLQQGLHCRHVPLLGGPHQRCQADASQLASESVLVVCPRERHVLLTARPHETLTAGLDVCTQLESLLDRSGVAVSARAQQVPICDRALVPDLADASQRHRVYDVVVARC